MKKYTIHILFIVVTSPGVLRSLSKKSIYTASEPKLYSWPNLPATFLLKLLRLRLPVRLQPLKLGAAALQAYIRI